MTAQQHIAIKHIEEQHEAQRFEASQASREQAEIDPRSVKIAIEVKLAEGRYEEAKAIYIAWKAGQL